MRVIYHRHDVLTDERITEYWQMLREPDCQRAVVSTLLNWNLDKVEGELGLIRQPTLVIWGRRDSILGSRYGVRLARQLSDARIELLECGHVPQEEMPDELATLVQHFISETRS